MILSSEKFYLDPYLVVTLCFLINSWASCSYDGKTEVMVGIHQTCVHNLSQEQPS